MADYLAEKTLSDHLEKTIQYRSHYRVFILSIEIILGVSTIITGYYICSHVY